MREAVHSQSKCRGWSYPVIEQQYSCRSASRELPCHGRGRARIWEISDQGIAAHALEQRVKYDFKVMEKVLRRDAEPEAIPLYEHFFDDRVIEKIMNYDFSIYDASTREGQLAIWTKKIKFFQQLGFVCVPMEMLPNFGDIQWLKADDTAVYSKGSREWMNERRQANPALLDLNDKEYWPEIDDAFDYVLFDEIAEQVPEGMKIIGGAAGGPFEHVCFNLGIERLCFDVFENPDFVVELFERVGERLAGIAKRLSGTQSSAHTDLVTIWDTRRQLFFRQNGCGKTCFRGREKSSPQFMKLANHLSFTAAASFQK